MRDWKERRDIGAGLYGLSVVGCRLLENPTADNPLPTTYIGGFPLVSVCVGGGWLLLVSVGGGAIVSVSGGGVGGRGARGRGVGAAAGVVIAGGGVGVGAFGAVVVGTGRGIGMATLPAGAVIVDARLPVVVPGAAAPFGRVKLVVVSTLVPFIAVVIAGGGVSPGALIVDDAPASPSCTTSYCCC